MKDCVNIKCIGCRICIDACPLKIIKMDNNMAVISDIKLCKDCRICKYICETNAMGPSESTGNGSEIV